MLFTRCPGCQTTFRITADTLRVAHGAVRCGSCATVFSAYSGLRQDLPGEELRGDDEFLSPALQTQELAGIEEIASPELVDTDERPDATPDGEVEDAGAFIVLETLTEEPPQGATVLEEPPAVEEPAAVEEPLSLEEPPAVEEALTLEESPAAEEPVARHEPQLEADDGVGEAEQPSLEGSGKLQFDAPVDEWAQLLSEIERSVTADASQADEVSVEPTDDVAEAPDDMPLSSDIQGPELWDVGEPFSLAAWDTGERKSPRMPPHEPTAGEERRFAAHEPRARDADEAGEIDADLDTEIAISAEEIDATLSAEPDPDLVAALEAGLGQMLPSEQPSRLWTIGTVALTVVLAMQMVHHFRAPLAGQPLVGGILQFTYGLVGLELLPEWNLEQYEITNWAATAGSGDTGVGNLHITAQIRNGGPRAQPYPNIQLELKDRWEAVIGSRVFLPSEYLAPEFDASGLMAVGATVPADLAVVDPGLDASGFELDVCLEAGRGRINCAADRVFE
jgi:predicted Zn finger-like uncharacterized protein